MNHKKKEQLSVYWIIGLILLVAIVLTCVYSCCVAFETWLLFWSGFVGGITTLIAVVYTVQNNWKQQYNQQKDNIKLQLFDKRYAVYNTLCEITIFINRQDIVLMIMSGIMTPEEIAVKLRNYSDDIREKARLSEALFDPILHSKMKELSNRYYAVFVQYLLLNQKKSNFENLSDDKKTQFIQLLTSTTLTDDQKMDEYKKIVPNMDQIMADWSNAVNDFNEVVLTY